MIQYRLFTGFTGSTPVLHEHITHGNNQFVRVIGRTSAGKQNEYNASAWFGMVWFRLYQPPNVKENEVQYSEINGEKTASPLAPPQQQPCHIVKEFWILI